MYFYVKAPCPYGCFLPGFFYINLPLLQSPESGMNNIFYNRATQEKTAPGSTYKMVSAVAALTEALCIPFRLWIKSQILPGIWSKIMKRRQ